MMHTGNNTLSSPYPYSSPMHDNVPVLPSQQHPPGQVPNVSTLSGSMGQYHQWHQRHQGSGSTRDHGSASSASSAPVAQHPPLAPSVDNTPPKLPNRGVRVVIPGSTASVSTTATAVKAKRKRSMIACRSCNERRVRCDGSITGLPCTTCKSAGRTDCAFIDSKRVRGKRGRFESRDKAKDQSETQSPITPEEEGPNRSQSMALTQSPRLYPAPIPQNLQYTVFPPHSSPSGLYPNMPYDSHIRSPTDNHIQLSGPDATRRSLMPENHIWRRLLESQPGVPQTQRSTEEGEAWSLSWPLHQKTGGAPLHLASPVVGDSPDTPLVRQVGLADAPLDKPSSHIAQMVSEIEGSNPRAAPAVQTSPDAIAVPPAPIRDALIEAYFSYFHPLFPILSKERFESHLNSSMTNMSPSPLLIQSMLMIGAMHCPLSLLTSPLASRTDWKPFPNRSTAVETFVRRARMLFNFDREKDRLSVVQSMFLLQFWWQIPGEYKDQSYWMAGALRIAQSMGLHRSTRGSWAKGILNEQERVLWRKMWWALYIRDRQIAAALGKPVLIHDADCDVEELSMQDFLAEPKETALFMIEGVKLIRVLHEILKCEFTPALGAAGGGTILPSDHVLWRERCQRMLEDWQRALPPELGVDMVVKTGNFEATGTAGSPQFYKRLMQLIFKIYFQSYKLLLHYPIFYEGPGSSSPTTIPESGEVAEGNPYANAPASTLQPPTTIASHAAKMVTQYSREVYAICNHDVRFLPLNYVSLLFVVLSVQLAELKSVGIERGGKVRDDVSFNLSFFGNLAEMYPIAGWCRKRLVKILNETEEAEGLVQRQGVCDKTKGLGSSGSQGGLERIDVRLIQREVQSLGTNFGPESQYIYSQQRQDTDLHHPAEAAYENGPPISEGAYHNCQNAHPHYNPHHAYHNINFYQLPQSPGNNPGGCSHVSGSPKETASGVPQPAVVPASNPFDVPPLEAHSNRIRSMGIRYIDPSPTESPCPSRVPTPMATSAIAMPTIPISTSSSLQEREKQLLSEKWAGDVLLETNLVHVASGALGDSSQHQRESDHLRYHVMPGEHGVRLAEEPSDDDGDSDDDDEEDSLHGEDDRESVLLAAAAAAAAAAAVSGRRGSSMASGGGGNVNRREGGLPADLVVAEVDQGVLLGNPFLMGSNTDEYGNPVGGTESAVAHDPQHVPVNQGAYHHGIPYHTQHGHHH